MNLLGLSAFFHESACCLLRDGELVTAAAEERFSRVKHDPRLPVAAFRWCLEEAGITVADLDAVAYYEQPRVKLARQLWSGSPGAAFGGAPPGLPWLDAGAPERAIRERLGWDGPLLCYPHHLSHAASGFYFSGFERAAVLTADGVGEWATTAYGIGEGTHLETFEEVRFPHSLGLLYSTVTAYLGFRVNGGEYEVMGLAPYGEPSKVDAICQLVGMGPDGQYALNLRYFDFVRGARMYSDELPRLLGGAPRAPGGPIEQRHMDVARSLQLVIEEVLLEKAGWLHRRTGCDDLCLAGGVALNAVAVGRIAREGPFSRVFVQPAAGDAGGGLGAAALAWIERTGERPATGRDAPLPHAFWGPGWDADDAARVVRATGLDAEDHRGREGELVEAVAGRLAAGRVVGWFHGRMEIGPRALGARSLLADPRDPEMRDRLNRAVKRRQAFRPFAPSVLASRAALHFDLDRPAPFMTETCAVRSPLALPAVTHVDGSARPQTVDPAAAPRFAALLEAFERRTGCPVLLNTSFNLRGEPIVRSPADALSCFARTAIDTLVIEDQVIDREALPDGWPRLLEVWEGGGRRGPGAGGVGESLYTFV